MHAGFTPGLKEYKLSCFDILNLNNPGFRINLNYNFAYEGIARIYKKFLTFATQKLILKRNCLMDYGKMKYQVTISSLSTLYEGVRTILRQILPGIIIW